MKNRHNDSQSRRTTRVLVALGFLVTSVCAQAQPRTSSAPALSLEGYLDQVEQKNDTFQRSNKAKEAFELRAETWRLSTSPYVFGRAQIGVDQTETTAPAQMGTETSAQALSVGVGQKTNFGLDAKLSYNYVHTDINGTTVLPVSDFVTTGPVLELTQSLWRNGWGDETQATQEAQSAGVQAQKFGEQFTQTQLKAQAEGAYWRLAVAREAVTATRESLERTERGRDWTARRSRLELTDRADLIQQDAAVAARQVEVQQAEIEERAAARAFNTMRGLDSLEVAEKLAPITVDTIKDLKVPERGQPRADVLAAEQQAKAAKASARAGAEATEPTLDVFLKAGLGGRDASAGTSVAESLSTDHPNYAVGVTLNLPLERGILSRTRQSYRVEAESADLGYRRKVFENEREWTDLVQRFEESKRRLELARKLEVAQKAKLDAERERHRLGRSTTYSVILFEGDYAAAQLSRIRFAQDVLAINSQLKTFGGVQ